MSEPDEHALRAMHPAPSLEEAPPADFPRLRLGYDLKALVSDVQNPLIGNGSTECEAQDPEHLNSHGPDEPSHLLPRPGSTATANARPTSNRLPSIETTQTPSIVGSLQSILLNRPPDIAVKDGPDQPDQAYEHRTPGPKGPRRRTGPLNQEQRVKAAIIRKIGACQDCRRRRVSCDPAHHGETWDSAIAKYGSDVPGVELLPSTNPRDSVCSSLPTTSSRKGEFEEGGDLVSPPASAGLYHGYTDSEPTLEATGRRRVSAASFESSPMSRRSSDTQPPHKKRKPLPAARGDRMLLDTAQTALSVSANDHSQYTSVRVLHLQWDNEWRRGVIEAGMELRETLRDVYGFSYNLEAMPLGISHKSFRDRLHAFIDNNDERAVLKIIYYDGISYLDGNDNMMIVGMTGPTPHNPNRDICWKNVQLVLEEAVSDVLLIMDCPYWMPTLNRPFKRHGVLEILAGSPNNYWNGVIHGGILTKSLTKCLQDRATQTWRVPTYVTDVHAAISGVHRSPATGTSHNGRVTLDISPPLHILIAGEHTNRSSIQLASRSEVQPSGRRNGRRAEPEVIALYFDGEDEDREALNEWLRSKPDNVRLKTD